MDSGCHVRAGSVTIGNDLPFVLISGPCQIENRDHAFFVAERLLTMTTRRGIGFIYKSSFDKANRTSLDGARGAGMDEGLQILDDVRSRLGCPVLTDVHLPDQCPAVAGAVDVLQIPAFLNRQTDLLRAAGKTGKAVHIKKGQFMAPEDMGYAVEKVQSADGGGDILVCERGVCFGYHDLVVDMRGLVQMRELGVGVVFDATHSTQRPSLGDSSGGDRLYTLPLARAAASVGVNGIFFEIHPQPQEALSDAATQLPLEQAEEFMYQTLQFHRMQVKLDGIIPNEQSISL